VYRPAMDCRDLLEEGFKAVCVRKIKINMSVFLFPIPDSSQAVGKPIQPPRSPLVSDAKTQNAAGK